LRGAAGSGAVFGVAAAMSPGTAAAGIVASVLPGPVSITSRVFSVLEPNSSFRRRSIVVRLSSSSLSR